MPVIAKNKPEPLVGKDGGIAHGTPLARLRDFCGEDSEGVYVGDVRDCLNQTPDCTVKAKLVKAIGDKPKYEKVFVSSDDAEELISAIVDGPKKSWTQATESAAAPIEVKKEAVKK